MTTIVIRSKEDLRRAFLLASKREKFPFTLKIEDGELRSLKQNKLYHMWMKELEDQTEDGGWTAKDYTVYCKLHFGVGIMKAFDLDYAAQYDLYIRDRYDYEEKKKVMQDPYGWPVTSLMKTRQFRMYLDEIWEYWTGEGFTLTDPDRIQE